MILIDKHLNNLLINLLMQKGYLITIEPIKSLIYLISNQKVMLDQDIAKLYRVEKRKLNEQVKRNKDRFPTDFMFQLTEEEFKILKSQIETSS